MPLHQSHKTRMSFDASTFDEICTICGATDQVPGGWGDLQYPCKGAKVSEATTQQQPPVPCDGDDIWLLVIRDMDERRKFGIAKYGQPVRADNGRDSLLDLREELLDAIVYLRQYQEGKKCLGESLVKLHALLVGSQSLTGANLAEAVSLLESVLRKNPALCAG